MDVQAWDSVFMRARRTDIHAVLEQVAAWGTWWPQMTTEAAGDEVRVTLRRQGRLGAVLAPPQRYTVRITKNRRARALGLDLHYSGALNGEAELYYLDELSGTVVTYLLRASVAQRGWRATLGNHRAGIRAGLDALKDRFEAQRIPGAEPDPALLRDQQAAMLEFRRGIEEWTRKQAEKAAAAKAPPTAAAGGKAGP